jgi:TIR domain
MPQYDLFVSYRREDADRVLPLVEALRERNLRVWLDQRQIGDFAAITDEIRSGLARSKALLAWYSADYPRSRPCQMELTAALIAAQQDGDPRRRVLIVNPEHDARHVVPEKLADEQHLPALDAKELAERIGGHIRRLQGTLGAILPCQLPVQYGRRLAGANRFVGRLTDLWLLNSALHAGDSTIISKSHGPGLAIVSGLVLLCQKASAGSRIVPAPAAGLGAEQRSREESVQCGDRGRHMAFRPHRERRAA